MNDTQARQAMRELMENWNLIQARLAIALPDSTPEKRWQIAATIMDESLGLTMTIAAGKTIQAIEAIEA